MISCQEGIRKKRKKKCEKRYKEKTKKGRTGIVLRGQ